jgi:hypothetical protein
MLGSLFLMDLVRLDRKKSWHVEGLRQDMESSAHKFQPGLGCTTSVSLLIYRRQIGMHTATILERSPLHLHFQFLSANF